MKKNNSYISDDKIDLFDFIKSLWRKKILILSISIICGLAGYLNASFRLQEFKTEIHIKDPPHQLFEPYSHIFNKNKNNNIDEQFISGFKLNLLSLDSLQSFIEESRELDSFKAYLKSRNISVKQYSSGLKLREVKEKDITIPKKYFLVFANELDGDTFINNYVQFVKKKTTIEIKNLLKLSILAKLTSLENALENATLINLENPILRSMNQSNQVINEPEDLFYKGSKIISQEIIYLKRLMIKLENDQFDFQTLVDKPVTSQVKKKPNLVYFAIGLMFGLFLSSGIIFFKYILKNN